MGLTGSVAHERSRVLDRDVARFLLAITPGLLFAIVFLARSSWFARGGIQFSLFDDAMINLTYGRTLARTGELVWFPGAPRVQGITTPLWIGFMALVHLAGFEGSSAALTVSLVGLALIIASAVVVFRLVRRHVPTHEGGLYASLAAGTVTLLYPLSFWVLRGFEVGLLAFLSVLIIDRLTTPGSRAVVLAGVAGVVGVLTRLDFAVVVAAVGVGYLIRSASWADRTRLVLGFALPSALAAGAVLLFQWQYYGDWLPNTYRLKVEGYDLMARAARGGLNLGRVAPLVAIVIAALYARRFMRQRSALAVELLTLGFAAGCLYSVWVGGDTWEFSALTNRFITVGLPAVVALAFIALGHARISLAPEALQRLLGVVALGVVLSGLLYGVRTNPVEYDWKWALAETLALGVVMLGAMANSRGIAPDSRRAAASGLICATVLITSVSVVPTAHWVRDGGVHVRDDQRFTEDGIQIAAATSQRAVIATVIAGAPGYYAERTMIDLIGFSDDRIATLPPVVDPSTGKPYELFPGHNKWDYEYSIGMLRPDVVTGLWYSTQSDRDRILRWGYVVRCLPNGSWMYWRQESGNVRWDALTICDG